MKTTFYIVPKDDYLMHYGVKGMKWGVRKAVDSIRSNKQIRKQLATSKRYAKKHSTVGIIARQYVKAGVLTIGSGLLAGMAAVPLSMALGPAAAPVIGIGMRAAGMAIGANAVGKGTAAVYYRHEKGIKKFVNNIKSN